MLGWLFKRSKRQVIRDNAARGTEGERQAKAKYEMSGYEVERTGHGSDYKVSRRNWFTGKKESKLVEVKTGNAKLSPLQKKRKRSWGKRYIVERMPDSPFSRPASERSSPAPKKRKKSPVESFWGSSSSSSSSGGGSKKRRKSAAPSFWGSSSSSSSSGGGSKKRRKSAAPSFWG